MTEERAHAPIGARDDDGAPAPRTRGRHAPGAPLSDREREILGLLATCESGAQIAERLVLSPETVRTHIRNAMSKLGASSRAQAVALAVQRQEIDGPGQAPEADAATPGAAPTAAAPPRPASGRSRSAFQALSEGDSDATLTALLAGVISLYDVDGGTVFVVEDGGLSLRRAAFLENLGAEAGDESQPDRVMLGEGALGRAALERRAQVVHAGGGADARGRTTIAAPMSPSGNLVGVICLTTRPSRLTGRGEMLLLQAFANRVGEVLLGSESERTSRLKEALERFRASWSAANGAV